MPDNAIQRGERLLGLAGGLVGARELVQHLVVARVVRIGFEQRRVQLDGLAALQVDRGDLFLHALDFAGIEVEVAQAAHGFGAQLRIGLLQLEEAAIVFHRLAGVGIELGVLFDRHGLLAQVLDGALVGVLGIRSHGGVASPCCQQHAQGNDAQGHHGFGSLGGTGTNGSGWLGAVAPVPCC